MTFINDNFLLESTQAEELYHSYAKGMPILDYHNHLPSQQIAEDHQFNNLTEVWLDGDHYKWRAMRTMGVQEHYITGAASDQEKFQKWAETVPYTLRNPLYHWTHLELKRYFGIDRLLTEASGQTVYEETAEKLRGPGFSTRGLLQQMKVEVVCTTDDPTDTLEHHQKMARTNFGIKVRPAFRPDKALQLQAESYPAYLEKLGESSGVEIRNFDTFCDALNRRLEYFHTNGCRLSDHGLTRIPFAKVTGGAIKAIFQKRLNDQALSPAEAEQFQTAVLLFLGKRYAELGWVQQFHLGAQRNNNSRMLRTLGPDTGWDSIGDYAQATTLGAYLDALDSRGKLARTILYNLNPADNEVLATMAGNFNDGSLRGKMQFGSGWWFLDQKDGIEKQLNALSNMGLISCFIGMLTDSRSFLSFPRHEYFRRLLCNILGWDIKKGLVPNDMPYIGGLVQDICYRNARDYFDFEAEYEQVELN